MTTGKDLLSQNRIFRNTAIFLSLLLLSLFGLNNAQFHGAAAFFYPAAGLYTAFYFLYRKDVLPYIASSIIIANIIFRVAFIDESIIISLVLSLLFTLSNIVEMYLFSFFMDQFQIAIRRELKFNEQGLFFSSVLLSGLVGAIIGVLSLNVIYGFDEFWSELLYWFIGSTSGILVFGSLILNSYFHDEPIKEGLLRYKSFILFIAILSLLVYLIFGGFNNEYLSFQNFQILIFLMYIIAAFKFSFRVIAISNIIILVGLNSFYLNDTAELNNIVEAIQINIFILILSIIASIVRIILIQRKQNLEKIKRANDNLERMIISTNQLFQIENKIPEEAIEFSRNYLKNMFEIACDLYPDFDRASCHMKQGKYVEFVGAKGYDLDHLNQLNFLSKEFVWSFDTPKIIKNTNYNAVFEDNKKMKDFYKHYGRLRESIRFTVIINENEYAGMSFDYYDFSEEHFSQTDIDNFKSFQSLMNSYYKIGSLTSERDQLKDDIVLSLVRTLELYDQYTGGHSEQVAKFSSLIAQKLHLPNKEIRDIYWAGILHDIGKIGLPEDILNKPGRLTDEEYDLVKNHSIYGYNILSESESLSNIANTVKHHHEWWNGQGYPDGLKENEIPFHSQILHVCDAVDAMSHNRVYHKKLSLDDIISELENGKGKQFSPKIVELVIDLIKKGQLDSFIK